MAVFDVTLARTATIFVEADTEEEAKFIAECQPESNCSWSDEWNWSSLCMEADVWGPMTLRMSFRESGEPLSSCWLMKTISPRRTLR